MNWARDGQGNRNPRVVIGSDASNQILRLNPQPGSTLVLDASNSTDPDGDALQFHWWSLHEAGTYPSKVQITDAQSKVARLDLPADSAGRTIHLICEVTDQGAPPLHAYRRIIVEPASR